MSQIDDFAIALIALMAPSCYFEVSSGVSQKDEAQLNYISNTIALLTKIIDEISSLIILQA